MEHLNIDAWEQIRSYLEGDDRDGLNTYLEHLSGAELVRALFRLSTGEQRDLLLAVPAAAAADIIEASPDSKAADLIEALPSLEAAAIVSEMASDEQADLLADLPQDEAEAILDEMEEQMALEVRELVSYPAATAGGLMVKEYLAFRPQATAGQALEEIALGATDLSKHFLQQIFVVGPRRKIAGTVRFRDLVFADRNTRLRDIMTRPTVVNVEADLATLSQCFAETDYMSLPVTSDDGTLSGVLLRSDMEEALAEKADADHLKSQGIVGGEELRTMSVYIRSRRRLSWLTINILLNIAAASVIAAFEETLAAVIALAVFLPIVSDMSGCSGNQAVAVSMRELTLGVVNARDVFRVWWQEVKVGVINGLVLGILLAIAAYLWKGNPALGLVIGLALCLNTIIAVSIGGTVPLLVKRLHADPAIASGPVLTTVTDMCGFFLVLGMATLALPWLI